MNESQVFQARLEPFRLFAGAEPIKAPLFLYHYTDAPGLMGIVTTQAIWATHFGYLNDSQEVVYAAGLVEELIEKLEQESVEDGETRRLLDQVRATYNPFAETLAAYVACFCSSGNLLSQWRGYGFGGGYSLGFRTSDLLNLQGLPDHQSLFLLPVRYKVEEQKRLIAEAMVTPIRNCVGSVRGAAPKTAEKLRDTCCREVADRLYPYLVTFKHPAFREEREWRLVHVREGLAHFLGHGVEFRPGKDFIVPYVPIELTAVVGVHAGRLPLERVWIGPTHEPEGAASSTSAFLQSGGLSGVRVTKTDIPLSMNKKRSASPRP